MDRGFQKPGIPAVFDFFRQLSSRFPKSLLYCLPIDEARRSAALERDGHLDEKVPAPKPRLSAHRRDLRRAHIRPSPRGLLPMTRSRARRGGPRSAFARSCGRRWKSASSTRKRITRSCSSSLRAGDADRRGGGRRRLRQGDRAAHQDSRPARPLSADRQDEPGLRTTRRARSSWPRSTASPLISKRRKRGRRRRPPRGRRKARIRPNRRGPWDEREKTPWGSAQVLEKARSGQGNQS
jgi:hypothetical protein